MRSRTTARRDRASCTSTRRAASRSSRPTSSFSPRTCSTTYALLLMSNLGMPYDPVKGDRRPWDATTATRPAAAERQRLVHGPKFKRYMGSGALAMAIDDFNADNFDHSGLGFIGGGVDHVRADGREADPEPHDAARDGPVRTRLEGRDPEVLRKRDQRRLPGRVARVPDAPSRPRPELPGQLRQPAGPDHVRLGGERAQDDRVRGHEDARDHEGDQPGHHLGGPGSLPAHYDTAVYQSTHNTGGAIMGADPARRSSTRTCRCGTRRTCSSSARATSRRTRASTRPEPSVRSPTGPPRGSSSSTRRAGASYDQFDSGEAPGLPDRRRSPSCRRTTSSTTRASGSRCATGTSSPTIADPEQLRAHPDVRETDDLFPVGEPPSGFYLINV